MGVTADIERMKKAQGYALRGLKRIRVKCVIDRMEIDVRTLRDRPGYLVHRALEQRCGQKGNSVSPLQRGARDERGFMSYRITVHDIRGWSCVEAILAVLRDELPWSDEPRISLMEFAWDFWPSASSYPGHLQEVALLDWMVKTSILPSDLWRRTSQGAEFPKARIFHPLLHETHFFDGNGRAAVSKASTLYLGEGQLFARSYYKVKDQKVDLDLGACRTHFEIQMSGDVLARMNLMQISDLRGYSFRRLVKLFQCLSIDRHDGGTWQRASRDARFDILGVTARSGVLPLANFERKDSRGRVRARPQHTSAISKLEERFYKAAVLFETKFPEIPKISGVVCIA